MATKSRDGGAERTAAGARAARQAAALRANLARRKVQARDREAAARTIGDTTGDAACEAETDGARTGSAETSGGKRPEQ